MIIVVDGEQADGVAAQLTQEGETVYRVGQVQAGEQSQVSFIGKIGS